MLSLYRRHLKKCPHRTKGREYTKCSCPIWCNGTLQGERYGRSLKTRNWQRALRLADHLEHPNAERSDLIPCEQPGCNQRVEEGRCEKHRRIAEEAIAAFFVAHPDLGHGTVRNYRRTLKFFAGHVSEEKLRMVDEITADTIESFRNTRTVKALTWTKELEILRRFFRYCVSRKWTSENPAAAVKMPKNIKPTDKEPYSSNEIIKILAACDAIGQRPYERLRARAMVLLLRYTALRIGDVALLAKDRVRRGEIYLRTMKNGKVVKLPVPSDLQEALEALPEPSGAKGESKYFFWSGNGTERSMVRDATRTMAAVFKASGVKNAHAHRFRHTLATEILESDGTCEDAAEVLGNSPNIIKKHYAKWSRRRQERISSLLQKIFATPLLHEKTTARNR
jgi:site-specific recombinase XerD